ncbi:cyclase dehydrase [Microvirga sp. VF16]|uniref:cyclase dehydrase n=1 Tax=Microvirga sp. VF16 TaxID=2807101 RepID=UPI00193D6619|nr:cyclase dehydrase [Microvirga sp. VF16]QRM28725.1 cyclase dehydrase [Microvirga sp. VF16]
MRYETERTRRRGQADTATDTLARGLGLFSIALGIAEIAAPRAMARALGMKGQEGLIAGYGVREIATGIGILASKDPTPWIWGRVAGDGLDLATLATALEGDNPRKGKVGIAMAAVAGVTALDVYCAQTLSRESPHPLEPLQDYSDRTGYPRGIERSHGAASDFEVPRDFRTPEALRPYTQPESPRHPRPSM